MTPRRGGAVLVGGVVVGAVAVAVATFSVNRPPGDQRGEAPRRPRPRRHAAT